jgi:hypothetical protein
MRFSNPTRFNLATGILTLALCLAGSAYGSTTSQSHRTHHATVRRQTARHGSLHGASYRHTRNHRVSSRHHSVNLGQRAMDSQRAIAIQQALIQVHYLSGSPTGAWDPETQAAMQKYQADNGWQVKITPDSRAIIKLGLGPKQDDGEYPAEPTRVSSLSGTQPDDSIRTQATSESPSSTQN